MSELALTRAAADTPAGRGAGPVWAWLRREPCSPSATSAAQTTKNKATLGLGRGKDVFLMAEPVIPIWGFIGTAKPAPIQYKGEPAAPTRLSGHYDHNFHNRQGLLAKADTEFTESHRAHREKTISLNPLCNSVALCALCVTLRVLFHPCHRS